MKENVLRVANAALHFKPVPEDKVFSKTGVGADYKETDDENAIKKLYRLWIIDQEGKVKTADITTGIYDTRYTEIVTGDIKEGQKVIIGYHPEWRKADSSKKSFFRFGTRQ